MLAMMARSAQKLTLEGPVTLTSKIGLVLQL